MFDWPAMIANAESMVRRILPEYTGPIYLVPCTGTAFTGMAPVGMTGPGLDLLVRPYLADRWRGRGFAVVFNRELIEAEYNAAAAFNAMIVHELAHAVADGWIFEQRTDPGHHLPLADSLAQRVRLPFWFDDDGKATEIEFQHHDFRWVRAALHLSARADLCIGLVTGDRDEISPPFRYMDALGGETWSRADEPLNVVLDSAAPAPFMDLWAWDVKRFFQNRQARVVPAATKEEGITVTAILDNLLSKLSGRRQAKEKSAAAQFVDLARDIADGKEPADLGAVEKLLMAASKTADDLASEVKHIQRRRQLQVTVGRAPDVARERTELQAKFNALKVPMDRAVRAFEQAAPAIQHRNAELDAIESQIKAARQELADTSRDEELLTALAAIDRERQELQRQIELKAETHRKLRDTLAKRETDVANVGPAPGAGGWTKEAETPQERINRIDAALVDERAMLYEAEGEIAALDKERHNIATREAQLRERMLLAAV